MAPLCLSLLLFVTLCEHCWVKPGDQGWPAPTVQQREKGREAKKQLQKLLILRNPCGRHSRGAGEEQGALLNTALKSWCPWRPEWDSRLRWEPDLSSYPAPGSLVCGTLLASTPCVFQQPFWHREANTPS